MPNHGQNLMSWTSHLKCKICKTLYDDYTHRPMILLECGHTICHKCSSAMGKREGKITCPDDKTVMALNRVAPNLTLLQMLKRICTVCERIFGEELKEEPTEKKYFCGKCLDLLNKRKDEVKRNIWAKIAVIQKKNTEAVEAIQTLVLMLENLKKEYVVHEKQRVEKCEFLRCMLETESGLEEHEVREFMEDVEKMNREREKRKIDLKAIEHIKMLMDELFTKKDSTSFLNFIQLHSKSLEQSSPGNCTDNGYNKQIPTPQHTPYAPTAAAVPQNVNPHHPDPRVTAAQLQQQNEAQVRKILRSGCVPNSAPNGKVPPSPAGGASPVVAPRAPVLNGATKANNVPHPAPTQGAYAPCPSQGAPMCSCNGAHQ